MSAKEKESKSLRRLKQFLGLSKGGIGTLKSRQEFVLTPEFEQQLRKETPLNQRGRALKDLCEAVKENSVEYGDMEKLRILLEDLFHPDTPREYRLLAFSYYRCLIIGQYDRLHKMRVHVFNIIKENGVQEDVPCRLDLLNALTDCGKVIEHLEEKMGQFLLEWMPDVLTAGKTEEFLVLLVNVVKYNAAYMDDDVVLQLVQNVCYLCCWCTSKEIVMGCLQVLDTIVRYSNLPSDSLQDFVSALCRTVNIEAYCQESWKIMRNLLGTHMGHAALYTMCRILQKPEFQQDIGLMRGAVFYINMGLWGNKRVQSLVCTETSVLPSLLMAASAGKKVVVYEVMLSCQRLVNKYGVDLKDPAWDLLLSILEAVVVHIEATRQPSLPSLVENHLHETLGTIEKLIGLGQFNGSVRRVFELIERCSPYRPEASVMHLIKHLSSSIVPTRHLWLVKLIALLEKFYRLDTRTNIRVKTLSVLDYVIQSNRPTYEDELIDKAVVPFLAHIEQDQDVAVRNAAAGLLIDLCLRCESKRCLELLDILEKLLNRPFDVPSSGQTFSESELVDVCRVAKGMVHIFVAKMYQLPSAHAIRAYGILVNHLDYHYRHQSILDLHPSIRYPIFECFLRLRANSSCQLGYPGGCTATPGKPFAFSRFLGVDSKIVERNLGASSPPPVSPAPTPYPPCVFTTISLTHAGKSVITGLKSEKDWKVLHLILTEVPEVLKNKALILSRHAKDIEVMAVALCSMLNDKYLVEALRNTPLPKFPRAEFQSYLFPILASLASYHAHLEPGHQRLLISSLEYGLQSRSAGPQVVSALTTCTLEMKDTMYKLLPEVLLNLSKISDTVQIAFPILSFLSTLTRLPKVFASFVGDQYMSVLAISLPYSNPFKYNHFIVSLAHHVIAVWFLKCRLPFRRDFVKFITKSLKSNVRIPTEDGQSLRQDPLKVELVNEDSSSRKRSSSLTEQGSRRRTVGPRLDARLDLKPPVDESLTIFHMELTETCIDLMARYTYSTCSAMPKRLPAVHSLLFGGQSMTWLLGNRLITVTTSGCNQKVLRNGLCDKCLSTCRLESDVAASPTEGLLVDPLASTNSQSQTQDRVTKTATASEQTVKAVLQRSSSVDVTATGRDEAPTAAACASSGGSSKNLSVLTQVSQTGVDSQTSSSSTGNVSSPTEENRRLSASLEGVDPETTKLDHVVQTVERNEQQDRHLCACWCNGWAEIYVRRPTGDMSWVMRIQNQNATQDVSDLPTLFFPSLMRRELYPPNFLSTLPATSYVPPPKPEVVPIDAEADPAAAAAAGAAPAPGAGTAAAAAAASAPAAAAGAAPAVASSEPVNIPASPVRRSPSRQSSRDSLDGEEEGDADLEIDDGSGRARNPVRRSNSSPEMSAGWRNPFLAGSAVEREKMDKMTKPSYSKDLRANCEAIPEEIAGLGTTPPSTSPIVARFTGADAQTVVPTTTATNDVSPSAAKVDPAPTAKTSPLLLPLPSALSAKPPLSPTQARHPLVDAPVKPVLGTMSPNILTRERAATTAGGSGRLSSGSASSSVGGSTSSLDSKANPEQLQLQLDRRVQQTSAPASPTTSHPHHLSASAERINRDDGNLRQDPAALPPLSYKRDRGHTISVMSPVRKPRGDWEAKRNKNASSTRGKESQQRSSVNPNLIFLQLYHSSYFGSTTEKPLLVSNSTQFQRSIKVLDLTPPYETHKVGVLYIARGQTNNEQDILRNTTGSYRYTEFLQRLGTLISLEDPDPHLFLGGLETSKDGIYAYYWQDDVTQVTFHVATLMPTRETDPSCNDKKRHIGNNFVTIVYNESGEDYSIHTVKGQFNYACVEIQPLDHGSSQVIVRTRDELADLGLTCEPKVVSDPNLGILARQLALHANLASHVLQSLKMKGGSVYASNWLERLRHIKRMRTRILQDTSSEENSGPSSSVSNNTGNNNNSGEPGLRGRSLPDDFTDYT